MNPRLEKTIEQISKTNGKISELQATLKELEHRKVQLENAEIIAAVRSGTATLDDIARLLSGGELPVSAAYESVSPPIAAPVYTHPETPFVFEDNNNKEEEDDHDAE